EAAGIEEVRADAPRLEGEFAETERLAGQGMVEELALVGLHGDPCGVGGDRGRQSMALIVTSGRWADCPRRRKNGIMAAVFRQPPGAMRITTFNANGIRSAASKGFFDWFATQGIDILCLQETKAQEDQLVGTACLHDGYHCFF